MLAHHAICALNSVPTFDGGFDESSCSGAFLVEDKERRQADVGDFSLTERSPPVSDHLGCAPLFSP